jgi:hypothetical protein
MREGIVKNTREYNVQTIMQGIVDEIHESNETRGEKNDDEL